MKNCDTEVKTDCFASYPPPPPLIPPLKLQASQNFKCLNSSSNFQRKSSEQEVVSALRHITYHLNSENPVSLISVYYSVNPIIQIGRCCGIVALSMASQLICDTFVDDILSKAKSLGITKEGELFSAFNMASLAGDLLKCNVEVLHDLKEHKLDILKCICEGNPVLIPYDADKNHFPCINHGQSAHWAVVTGVCFSVSDKADLRLLSGIKQLNEFPLNVYVLNNAAMAKDMLKYAEKIYLYAHQGKSRHLSAWDFDDLIKSNSNMFEVTQKYSLSELVLPVDDHLSELRNKIVLLKKQCQNN